MLFVPCLAKAQTNLPEEPHPNITEKVIDKNYFIINGLHAATAITDIVTTHSCVKDNTCHEDNPILGTSLTRACFINVATVSLGAIFSYEMKKRDIKFWYIVPSIGTASHSFGIVYTWRNR